LKYEGKGGDVDDDDEKRSRNRKGRKGVVGRVKRNSP